MQDCAEATTVSDLEFSICPRCEKEKPKAEMSSNSGVCSVCLSEIQKKNKNLHSFTAPEPEPHKPDDYRTHFESGAIVPTDEEVIHDSLTQQFNYDSVTPEEKRIHERAEEIAEQIAAPIAAEKTLHVLNFIVEAKNVRLAADQMLFMLGAYTRRGETMEMVGAKHGVSKQDFQKGLKNFQKKLALRKNRLMKNNTDQHSFSNHRNHKIK